MRKRDITMFEIIAGTTMIIGIVMFVALYGGSVGFTAEVQNDLILLIPGLLFFMIGVIVTVVAARGIWAVPMMLVTGIGMAMTVGTLDSLGLITVQMYSGLTLPQTQVWVILLFGLLGAVLAAVTR